MSDDDANAKALTDGPGGWPVGGSARPAARGPLPGAAGRPPAPDEAVTAPAQGAPPVPSAIADAAAAMEPDHAASLGRRNDRILLAAVGGYIALLTVLMIVRGVSITPDVLLVALGLAAVLIGRGRLFLRDWIPFIGLFFAYELMRGYADNFGASVHVADILGLERSLFFGYLPTQVLQDWLHPATGTDLVAVVATIFYFLHFPLPIAVGFFLWLRRRRAFYDFVAALIVLSMAGFVTFLLLPVAPPWWAAQHGYVAGPNGLPAIAYLKQDGFDALARTFGFEGSYIYSYTIYDINPNQVAAFPSLHAGYPFLAFLFARRFFGRIGWLMLGYAACVWFSVVYLADHYVVDVIGGVVYASAAYWVVIHAPGWARRLVDRAADEDVDVDAAARGSPVSDAGVTAEPGLAAVARRVRWSVVGQGLIIGGIGAFAAIVMVRGDVLGGAGTPLYLVPWFAVLGGLWRAAAGLLSR